MYSTGVNPNQDMKNYSVPSKDVGAVNIYITNPGINQPPPYPTPQYYYSYPPHYYHYYTPQYYYWNQPQAKKPIASQRIEKEEPPKPEQTPEKTEPEKKLTPITEELVYSLSNLLTQGDKESRIQTIARVLKLLREDPENRKNDPRLIGLINTALHPNQPDTVQTAAIIACNNGLVNGNEITAQLLTAKAGEKDIYGTDSLAASALSRMSDPGQRLNLISS